MKLADGVRFNSHALLAYPVRSGLILVAISIGVVAVVLLTSLGEGARRYVGNQFESLGTNLLIVLPGKSETTGGAPPLTGESPRDLTLDDAIAISRGRLVARAAPVVIGNAPVSYGPLEREITVFGSTPDLFPVLNLGLANGQLWTSDDPHMSNSVCILGAKLKQELFASKNALGAKVRVGDSRFRVIGIMNNKEQSVGLSLNDMLIMPVASAQSLLNSPALFRVMASARRPGELEAAKKEIIEIVKSRHNNEEDITVLTQDALLSTFDDIIKVLTYAIAGIGSISLLVAGVLTMNVMLVSVSQRRSEIGLLKALGASTGLVTRLFLGEALLLSLTGGVVGSLLAMYLVELLQMIYSQFPLATPGWTWMAVALVTFSSGLIFGAIPARRAAKLHPVIALSGK